MKKRTIILAMTLLLIIPLAAQGFFPKLWMRVSAGNTTTNNSIIDKPGWFYGLVVHTDGSTGVEINVYDTSDTTADQAFLIDSWIVTTSSTDRTQSISFEPPVNAEFGIHVDVSNETGGTITYDVFYRASDD